MACVDLPAFPLQILFKRHPNWRGLPAAVIDEDRPQGILLWVNEHARKGRVLSGMRYAAALSLSRDLRAGVVSSEEIHSETEMLIAKLRFFSPEVEHAPEEPGTFWLGAEGLGLVHPSFIRWAEWIRADLAQTGYDGHVAVGFSRFGSYAAAHAMSGQPDHANAVLSPRDIIVFRDPTEEHAVVRRIPMDRIGCDPDLRDTLDRLGITTLGGFMDLPSAGVRKRFGAEAAVLHRMAGGEYHTPFVPNVPEESYERRITLDAPENDTTRLFNSIEEELRSLMLQLSTGGRALTGLILEFHCDRPGSDGVKNYRETLSPARPTCDAGLIAQLLKLRLESIQFPSGVVDVWCEAAWCKAEAEQMLLFSQPHRDLDAANRALARIRAAFGEDVVSTISLREAHLPEACVAFVPVRELKPARPRAVHARPLVRRMFHKPRQIHFIGHPVNVDLLGTTILGIGVIQKAVGPYIVSGGWWKRSVARHYWYVLVNDAWLWIYNDIKRRKWFLQGGVE